MKIEKKQNLQTVKIEVAENGKLSKPSCAGEIEKDEEGSLHRDIALLMEQDVNTTSSKDQQICSSDKKDKDDQFENSSQVSAVEDEEAENDRFGEQRKYLFGERIIYEDLDDYY